jgi:hypothetical protein
VDSTTTRTLSTQTAFKMAENINHNDARVNAQNNYWNTHWAAKADCEARVAAANSPEERLAAYRAFDAAVEQATTQLYRELGY